MIKKENSQTLMDQIDTTIQSIADIKQDMAILEKQISTKLNILQAYTQLAGSITGAIQDIEEKTRIQDTIVFMLDNDNIIGGAYSMYGHTIHPQMAGLSDQMFNFITNTGPLFKDNATVTFEYETTKVEDNTSTSETVTDYQYQYCDMLKHEADPSKKDVFKTFPVNHIKMIVELRPTNLIGNTYCNLLEVCPYLPGSFTINKINVWTLEQYLSGQEMDELSAIEINQDDNPYVNVGPERISLGQTYQIWRAEFDITINIGTEYDGYPFGLRHLYFYHAKMDTQNSYIICKIHKDSYIDKLPTSEVITTPSGKKIFREECLYYAAFENNTLQVPLKNTQERQARNLKDIYIYIPIKEPIKAITFDHFITRS